MEIAAHTSMHLPIEIYDVYTGLPFSGRSVASVWTQTAPPNASLLGALLSRQADEALLVWQENDQYQLHVFQQGAAVNRLEGSAIAVGYALFQKEGEEREQQPRFVFEGQQLDDLTLYTLPGSGLPLVMHHVVLPEQVGVVENIADLLEAMGLEAEESDPHLLPQLLRLQQSGWLVIGFPQLSSVVASGDPKEVEVEANWSSQVAGILHQMRIDGLAFFTLEHEDPGTSVHLRSWSVQKNSILQEEVASEEAAAAVAATLANSGLLGSASSATTILTVESGLELGRRCHMMIGMDGDAGRITQIQVGGNACLRLSGSIVWSEEISRALGYRKGPLHGI
ncbi:MAG: hypothetical protein IMW91_02335 [Firmicutes bacterium]|nr:hypothetical protein [Bacillota bacterium]